MLKIKDSIYGSITIDNEIIEKLIDTKPFQRLKGIWQIGATPFIYPRRSTSRYDHSIGVWYLSKYHNCDIYQQVAALLHDTPHTVYSHVVDFVFPNDKNEFHEKFLEKMLRSSDIYTILKENNLDLDKILSQQDCDLLTADLPDLSIDRIDYFFRDSYAFGIMSTEFIKIAMKKIKSNGKDLYFDEKDVRFAAQYSIQFMYSSRLMWFDATSCGAYFLLAECLKYALENKIIKFDDLFETDKDVLSKLRASGDAKLHTSLDRLEVNRSFKFTDKENSEYYGKFKVRFVEPKIKRKDDSFARITDYIPGLKDSFEEFKKTFTYSGLVQLDKPETILDIS